MTLLTVHDEKEGSIGISKLPAHLAQSIEKIRDAYIRIIPDKNLSTYHTWYADMPPPIQQIVGQLQQDPYWADLCNGSTTCVIQNVHEMDELYYSNPKKIGNTNLYGAAGNYDIHRDCFFNFNGIKFYRILIGLTDKNDNIVTRFPHLNVEHKLNEGDVIAFNFDRSTHQVIKQRPESTPRIMLKLHFIVCENCKYPPSYVSAIKQYYIWYESFTRYVMDTGTDPKTFWEFFCGTGCMYIANPLMPVYLAISMIGLLILIRFQLNIPFTLKNAATIAGLFIGGILLICTLIASFYWGYYKLTGHR